MMESRPPDSFRIASHLPAFKHVQVIQNMAEGLAANSPAVQPVKHSNSPADVVIPALSPPRSRSHSHSHSRYNSTGKIITPEVTKQLPLLPRPKTYNCSSDIPSIESTLEGQEAGTLSRPPKARKVPASNSRNDLGEKSKPPPAMLTQRSFPLESPNSTTTQDWVASQQSPSAEQPPLSPAQPKSARTSTDNKGSRPPILPIRGFKPSSRRSVEMAAKRASYMDPDSTLRGLEGHDGQRTTEQEELNSDESDLFLRAAREEELNQRANNQNTERIIRSDKRRVRKVSFGDRQCIIIHAISSTASLVASHVLDSTYCFHLLTINSSNLTSASIPHIHLSVM